MNRTSIIILCPKRAIAASRQHFFSEKIGSRHRDGAFSAKKWDRGIATALFQRKNGIAAPRRLFFSEKMVSRLRDGNFSTKKWNRDSATAVFQRKNGIATPRRLFFEEKMVSRLRDGSFLKKNRRKFKFPMILFGLYKINLYIYLRIHNINK